MCCNYYQSIRLRFIIPSIHRTVVWYTINQSHYGLIHYQSITLWFNILSIYLTTVWLIFNQSYYRLIFIQSITLRLEQENVYKNSSYYENVLERHKAFFTIYKDGCFISPALYSTLRQNFSRLQDRLTPLVI